MVLQGKDSHHSAGWSKSSGAGLREDGWMSAALQGFKIKPDNTLKSGEA